MQIAADPAHTGAVKSIPAGLAHAKMASDLKSSLPPLEAAFVDAMLERFTGFANVPETADTQTHFEQTELAYADMLRAITHQFPQAAITHALLAESLMLQRPWLLWEPTDSTPREQRRVACVHVPEIEEVLKTGLSLSPRHPVIRFNRTLCID